MRRGGASGALALLAPALVGALLAGWGAPSRPLWLDEILTAQWMRLPPAALLHALAMDLHPPLYFLLLRGLTGLTGISELTLRLPSILACGLGVAAWGWALQAERPRAALWTAWLVALSPLVALHGGAARYYALAALLAGLQHGFYLRATRHDAWWAGYAVVWAALAYTSYVAALLGLAHGLHALLFRRRALGRWALAALGVAVLFAPWLSVLHTQLGTARAASPALAGHGAMGVVLKLGYLAYAAAAGETLFPWRPLAWLAIVALGGLVALGLAAGVARSVTFQTLWLGLALSLVAVSALAPAVSFAVLPSRLLFLMPLLLWPAAAGLEAARPRHAAALLLALLLPWGWCHRNRLRGADYLNPVLLTPAAEAVAKVRTELAPRDAILSESDSGFDWYWAAHAPAGVPVLSPAAADSLAALPQTALPGRIWIVRIGRDKTADPSREAGYERIARRYGHESADSLGAVDETYWHLKSRLLGRPAYRHRATLILLSSPLAGNRPSASPGRGR